jgi:outer membrane receptor for monomeric catechols
MVLRDVTHHKEGLLARFSSVFKHKLRISYVATSLTWEHDIKTSFNVSENLNFILAFRYLCDFTYTQDVISVPPSYVWVIASYFEPHTRNRPI